ncbi:hypothetical protein ACNOYE_15215 [Nannocystaceae bacterium ST9]
MVTTITFVRASILSASFVLGLSACYTVDFDEQQADAYYCQADDECLVTQACAQFRCVDDRGPQITEITGPESLTVFAVGEPTLDVTFDVSDFVLDEGNGVQDGMGKVLLTIDPHEQMPISMLVDTDSAQLDLGAGLAQGPHRLVAQAVFGDGTPYTNPGATNHTVFFSSDGSQRPQIAILEPGPNHVHVANQPLEVRVANIGFEFVDNGQDCHVAEGCDPFAVDAMCLPAEMGCTEVSKTGHTHIYMLADYPDCLFDTPVGCNLDYLASVRPDDGNTAEVSAVIEGDRFPEAGNFILSAGMQYNNHAAYPNKQFVIFDQMPMTIIER